MENENEEEIIEWLKHEHVPDDEEEIEAKRKEDFRKSDKAALIRELIRKGKNPAQIKLYGPHILKARERDVIEKVREGSQKKRFTIGPARKPRTPRQGVRRSRR